MEVWGVPILAEVEDIVNQLRDELHAQGVDLLKDIKPTHNNLMVTCINHGDGNEKKPSCGISTRDVTRHGKLYPEGTVHCFTCDYTADFVEFVSHCFGHNDRGMFGYKWVTSNFVNLTIEKRKPIELNMSRDVFDLDVGREYVFEEELESYRLIHPYMYERKLTDKVIEYFDIGFDQKTNSLTFPVKDKDGQVLFIQRRSVDGKKFLNDVTTLKGESLFGLYQVYQNLSWIKELIVCESPIDALTCWTYREPAVATMQGIPTETQLKLLSELPIRKLISGLDNDEAGRKGEQRMKERLFRQKILFDIQFPQGVKDINDMTPEQFTNKVINLLI